MLNADYKEKNLINQFVSIDICSPKYLIYAK